MANSLHQTDLQTRHKFIVKAGEYLHKYGTPAHRLERVMTQVATSLGLNGVFLYTPTALIISLDGLPNETTYLRRIDSGAVNVDKLIRFDETLEALEAGTVSIEKADTQFDAIADSPAPFSQAVTALACSVSCAAVATLFGGGLTEVAIAGILGFIAFLIEVVHSALKLERGFLELFVGFTISVSAIALAKFVVPVDDRLVTLASLIILIPGLTLTVALTELAVGHLSAGVARLAGACVSLLTLTIGVALGWRIASPWQHPEPNLVSDLPSWTYWAAIVIAPMTFAIVFRARWPQWPTITIVAIIGVLASRIAGQQWGTEVGAFCGALAVGIGSNLYARFRNRPALVPLTPGIIVLVPGSLGFRSLTAFVDHETMQGINFAFSMMIVGIALVGGILTANAVVPPKRIL